MKRIIILLIAISCFYSSQAENNWEDVTQNFGKSISFKRIRVKNTKSSSGSYCCVFFSTMPNDNTTADTKYNINFYSLTIGDGVNQGYGINISNCTSVGDNWYEYEFKQPLYFSHYQSNTPKNQLRAYVNTNTSTKKTVNVTTAGTLSSYISDSEKNVIEELTISGKLNGTDFRFLREMAGRDRFGNVTNGKLKTLSLSNARIVSGGDYYLETGNLNLAVTENNTIPKYVFHDCILSTIYFPSNLQKIESEAFENCKSLTYIDIPSGVTSIGEECFNGCTSLSNIVIPSSVVSIGNNALSNTAWLDNKPSGQVVYAGKVAFCFKGGLGNVTSITFTSGTVGIADNAFENRLGLRSITFPSTIKHIGANAFVGCTSLSYITSNISSPFAIEQNVFDSSIYKTANLFVPDGKASTYSRTSGWSSFLNIIDNSNPVFTINIDEVDYELNRNTRYATVKQILASSEDIVIPSSVSFNNYSYTVKAIGDYIFQKDHNIIKSVSFPSTISNVSDKAFLNFGTLAIIWNSTSTYLPSNSFSSEYNNSNFLVYVKRSNLAPSGISNVVVNGTASEITLIDGSPFHCPQSFTANKISYSHNYSMTTGVGECAGWETIALPFTVETIKHEYKGDLVTFSNYTFDPNSNYRPFWLYSLSNNGFIRASSIQANTPYLISMPNNNKYTDTYNLSGKITFSSTYVTVESTKDYNLNKASYNGGIFIPNYTLYNASDAFALNVTNDFTTNSNYQKAGSVFLNNYRTIYPFEARFDMKSNTRSIDIIFADGETTDIDNVMFSTDEDKELNIISLSGHIIRKISQRDFENVWNTLPKGVYIVNGKKFIK